MPASEPSSVSGSWTASSVAAGIADSTHDGFGQNDTLIPGDTTATSLLATIASITIKGAAIGSVTPTNDFFGLTAQKIGKVSINGQPYPPAPTSCWTSSTTTSDSSRCSPRTPMISKSSRRIIAHSLERLEARIAPARW